MSCELKVYQVKYTSSMYTGSILLISVLFYTIFTHVLEKHETNTLENFNAQKNTALHLLLQ